MSATGRRLRKAAQRHMIETALRFQGCECDYNVIHTSAMAGVPRVRIEHDDGCPLIGRLGQVIIAFPKRCDR
jgi:hypothetical protein